MTENTVVDENVQIDMNFFQHLLESRLNEKNKSRLMTFNTREEALEYIEVLDSGIYYLRHGEYGRPIYKARKVRNQPYYGIYAEYQFYPGTFHALKNAFLEYPM